MLKLSNGLGSLTLVCSKCTREATIAAPDMESAVKIAQLRGWVGDGDKQVCPKCPAVRKAAA
jgi:hypothetical protein